MAPRDLELLRKTWLEPFSGYSRRSTWALAPDVDRVVACVILLAAMVLSGVALGTASDQRQLR